MKKLLFITILSLFLYSCSSDDECGPVGIEYSQKHIYKKVITYEYEYHSSDILNITERTYDDEYYQIPYENPLPETTSDTIVISYWPGGGGGSWGGLVHDIIIEYTEYNQFE